MWSVSGPASGGSSGGPHPGSSGSRDPDRTKIEHIVNTYTKRERGRDIDTDKERDREEREGEEGM